MRASSGESTPIGDPSIRDTAEASSVVQPRALFPPSEPTVTSDTGDMIERSEPPCSPMWACIAIDMRRGGASPPAAPSPSLPAASSSWSCDHGQRESEAFLTHSHLPCRNKQLNYCRFAPLCRVGTCRVTPPYCQAIFAKARTHKWTHTRFPAVSCGLTAARAVETGRLVLRSIHARWRPIRDRESGQFDTMETRQPQPW